DYMRRRIAAAAESSMPLRLLRNDIYEMQTKEGFRRAVVEVLRELRVLEPAPRRLPPLSLVNKDDEDAERSVPPSLIFNHDPLSVAPPECTSKLEVPAAERP